MEKWKNGENGLPDSSHSHNCIVYKNETGKGVNTMKELENEELERVVGGAGNTSDNPKGLIPGEKVYFLLGRCRSMDVGNLFVLH